MILGVSHFAFDLEEEFLEFLSKNEIHNVEVIFSKIKPWDDLSADVIKNYKRNLLKHDLNSFSTQSLFFNSGCDNLSEIKKVLFHIDTILEYCKILGIKKLVFGSPALRKKTHNWYKKLEQLFFEIDKRLEKTDIDFIIEPNSKIYNGEYFFTIKEIVEFIKNNNFYNIRTMICTHNLFLENESIFNNFINYQDYIKHIHISEIDLKPIKDLELHQKFSSLLKDYNYKHSITYEIKKCDNIYDTINDFVKIYK